MSKTPLFLFVLLVAAQAQASPPEQTLLTDVPGLLRGSELVLRFNADYTPLLLREGTRSLGYLDWYGGDGTEELLSPLGRWNEKLRCELQVRGAVISGHENPFVTPAGTEIRVSLALIAPDLPASPSNSPDDLDHPDLIILIGQDPATQDQYEISCTNHRGGWKLAIVDGSPRRVVTYLGISQNTLGDLINAFKTRERDDTKSDESLLSLSVNEKPAPVPVASVSQPAPQPDPIVKKKAGWLKRLLRRLK
jgi:hypothetical protein